MRRSIALFVVLAMAAAGCSSGEALAVELSFGQEHTSDQDFSSTGAAVDEGWLCAGGTMNYVRLESMEGDEITDDDWAGMFDEAMETEGVAEMYVIQEFACGDDSGSFTTRFHNRFDFAVFEFTGRQDVGDWEITEGTGDHDGLAGSGEVTLDWDAEKAVFTGTIE